MTQAPPIAAPVPAPLPAPIRAGLWLPVASLWRREIVRFLRQRSRVVGALATPIVFWLLLAAGLNRSFDAGGAVAVSFGEYFLPGTVTLILLFTAIFSTISVIEDRREGFLQGVLVAPVPRLAIVLGKVLGGATLATGQGLLVLPLLLLVAPWPGPGAMALMVIQALGVMFLMSLGLTALGLCIAWPMDSTAGFHAIMNLFLMPMWFLSGALFPLGGAHPALRAVMCANPLTYGQSVMATVLTGGRVDTGAPLSPAASVAIGLAATAAVVALACRLVSRPRRDGLA